MSSVSHLMAAGSWPIEKGAPSGLIIASPVALARPAPLRLQVFSDLHADVSAYQSATLAAGVDAVVVAGDVCEGARRAYAYLRTIVPLATPIVIVLGNHEYYRGFVPEVLDEARSLAASYNIRLLENEGTVIAGVRFLGCTLWTDYCLDPGYSQTAAMNAARYGMNDHRLIGWRKDPWERFRPEEALQLHVASRAFLEAELRRSFPGPTVVVTHHAPHPGSVDERFRGDPLTPAFASDLSDLITAYQPALWVHGHVHTSFDYDVGRTRILCNPHGYGRENPVFNSSLVVEIVR